jgi:hypothetical protein
MVIETPRDRLHQPVSFLLMEKLAGFQAPEVRRPRFKAFHPIAMRFSSSYRRKRREFRLAIRSFD